MFGRILRAAAFAAIVIGLSVSGAVAGLKSEKVTYKVGDRELTGYMVWDDAVAGKRPGVLVVHEWWGHDAYARSRADKLAQEGYTAFALDMYGTGRLADHPKDAKEFMMEVLKGKKLMHARFKGAYEVLKNHGTVDASKTGAIGYCFGGNVVLEMARSGVDLDAVAAFHASLGGGNFKATPGVVKARVRVFNGADDPFIKAENVQALKDGMRGAGVDFEYINYPATLHSFTNPAATAKGEKLGLPLRYDVHADVDSWVQTLALFEKSFK